MANRTVRTIRDIKDIEQVPEYTNEISDLLHTRDNEIYIRKNGGYEVITGLEKVKDDVTKHGQRLVDVEKINSEQRESIDDINQTLEARKEHIDKLKELEQKIETITVTDDDGEQVEYVPMETYNEFVENINQRVNEMFTNIINEQITPLKNRVDELEKIVNS